MLPEQIVYLGLILQLTGQASYLVSIWRGQAKPNLVSWFVWMLAPLIGFYFLIEAGAGFSALPVFMAGFGPLLVILFSIFVKNGYWKLGPFDLYCGALALLALACYIFTRNLGISIIFAILSDALAAVPTVVKSWKFPETENGWIYFCAMTSNMLGLLTISIWSFSISAFGISLVLQCLIILFCLYRKKITSIFLQT